MDYDKIASIILKHVGGEKNISHVGHCATRLRFNLIDEATADTEALKNTEGVVGVVSKGGQYQVIIGSDVPQVYQHLIKMIDLNEMDKKPEKKNGNKINNIIDTIAGIFTPILPPLTAAGMLKAVLALLVAFKWVDNQASTYQVINFMADATFYFLPVLLANSAAKKFGCNQYLAMMLGAMLIHPNFISMVATSKEVGEAITVFGLPIYNASYTSSVIPIILGVWLMSVVEPFADKISPKAIKYFTGPLITILITGIATLVVLGSLGYIISTFIAAGINTLNSYAGWLVPTLMGTFLPFLVMTGTHHAITPIGINNRMTMGFDTIIYPGQLASNVAQGAAALAVSVKTKNSELKQLTSATGITAVCGITEPVLFGVTMKIRTNLIAAMAGGCAGGLFMGLLNIKNFSGGSPGLLTLPSYIGIDAPMSNFYLACAGAAIAFAVSFIVSFVLFKDKDMETKKETAVQSASRQSVLHSPLKGKCIALNEVNDPTFANELIGKGIAILPDEGKLYAPADGTVKTVFATKHAITMTSEEGADLILHVGLDTVKLDGKYFNVLVKDGDHVKAGDLLMEFDITAIKNEGYDVVTPMVVANYDQYEFTCEKNKAVTVDDTVMILKEV